MQKYYKMKDEYPEIFKVSPPSEMKFMLEMQIQCMLPKKDESGRQIYIFRVGKSVTSFASHGTMSACVTSPITMCIQNHITVVPIHRILKHPEVHSRAQNFSHYKSSTFVRSATSWHSRVGCLFIFQKNVIHTKFQ